MNPTAAYQSSPAECRICSGVATGLHYGVVTCEGCKVFYKRYMGKHQQYRCYFGGSCVIDLRTRSRCKACRYKKCVDEGMSVEAIRLGRTPKMFKAATGPDLREARGDFANTRAAKSCGMTSVIVRTPHANLESEDTMLRPHDRGHPGSSSSSSREIRHVSENRAGGYPYSPESPRAVKRATHQPIMGRPAQLTFTDENQILALPDSFTDFGRPSRVTDLKLPGTEDSRKTTTTAEPSTLQKYWGVMRARNSVLEDSVRAVADAMENVFAEEIQINQDFFVKWHDDGEVPFQPEFPLDQTLQFVQTSMTQFTERLYRFALLLPGFTDLGQSDRTIIVRDRWYVSWLITHASSYSDDECYLPVGPYYLHYCRYWMHQMLDAHFVRFIFSVTADINSLQLNVTEIYLLLAVSFFRTGREDTVKEKGYCDFLYSHYLDALIHRFGHMSAENMTKLRSVIMRFSVVNEVHRWYSMSASVRQEQLRDFSEAEAVRSVIRINPEPYPGMAQIADSSLPPPWTVFAHSDSTSNDRN